MMMRREAATVRPSGLSRKPLGGLPKTVHGGQAWRLEGIDDYSHNLNPFGPPGCVAEIAAEVAGSADHYPDDSSIGFRTAVAREFGVEPENVIAGSGSSDIIRMFPNTFVEPGDRVVMFRPSFAEYTQQCRISGADIDYVPLRPENDYRIDMDELESHLADDVKALYVCNPNNPTGRVEGRERVLSIAEMCRDRGILMFLDETLLELVDGYKDVTCAPFVEEYGNIVVAGSLTKSFAIPGIRIGFGITSKAIADEMNKVRMTWNIGAIEQAVGERLISGHMDHVHEASKVLKEESGYMFSRMRDMGFPVSAPSDSFFFFCDISSTGMDSKTFAERMLEQGIMVRDCSSFGPDYTNCIRFCVKDRERDDRFLNALSKVLGA